MSDAVPAPGDAPEDDIILEIETAADGLIEGGEPDARVISPEDGVAALKAQLDEEKRAKAEALDRARVAEDRASQNERAAQSARGSEIEGRLGQLNAAIETIKAQADASDRKYEEALARGDYAAAAKAQREMSQQETYLSKLDEGKRQIEAQRTAPRQPQPQRQQEPADPFEKFVSNLAPKAQAWVRAHPDYVRDPQQNKRLVAAHANAVLDHDEGSDGYYSAVEQQLGIEKGVAPARRSAGPVAAPVSRGQPSLSRPAASSGQTTVKLTKSDVEMAKAMDVDLKTYAREKAAVAAEVARGEHRQ